MAHWMIVDGNGDQITDGVQDHEIYRMAQSIANKRGESVWAYCSAYTEDEPGIEYEPNEK